MESLQKIRRVVKGEKIRSEVLYVVYHDRDFLQIH